MNLESSREERGAWSNSAGKQERGTSPRSMAPYRDSALDVGFQKPQVLIGRSRNLGKQIGGGFVAKLVGFVDGSARSIGKSGKPLHQRFYVLLALYRIEIVFLDGRVSGRLAGRSIGHSTELGDALGDQVRLIFQMAGDGIEQFMQLEKLESLHVPMRVLHLRLQIDRVGETRVQNFDDFGLRVFLKIDAAGKMNFGSCGGHYFLLSGRSLGRSLVCILCLSLIHISEPTRPY